MKEHTSPGLWEIAASARSPLQISAPIKPPNSERPIIGPIINLNLSEEKLNSMQAIPYESESESDSELGQATAPEHFSPPTSPVKPKPRTQFTRNSPNSSPGLGPWKEIPNPVCSVIVDQGTTYCQRNEAILSLNSFIALQAHFSLLNATWINTSDTSTKAVTLTNKVAWLGWLITQLRQTSVHVLHELDASTSAEIEKELKKPRNFIGHIKNFLHARFGIFKPVTSWYLYTELLKEIKNQTQTTPAP